MTAFPATERTRLKRLPKRGFHDHETIYSVLDAAFLCHVGFVVDGRPIVIPTAYARENDTLILHGSAASRMIRQLSEGIEACVTVTIVDGLVLARSAFHHSINYRSAVLFGRADLIDGEDEKERALGIFMEHLTPGRWDETRKPDPNELKGTSVIRFRIDEASAKIRTGDPVDDDDDHALDAWAGVIPLAVRAGDPIPSRDLREGIGISDPARRSRQKWS